ncbi:hypothetical protein ACTXT7_014894 [Hymenolepis weldensis]
MLVYKVKDHGFEAHRDTPKERNVHDPQTHLKEAFSELLFGETLVIWILLRISYSAIPILTSRDQYSLGFQNSKLKKQEDKPDDDFVLVTYQINKENIKLNELWDSEKL